MNFELLEEKKQTIFGIAILIIGLLIAVYLFRVAGKEVSFDKQIKKQSQQDINKTITFKEKILKISQENNISLKTCISEKDQNRTLKDVLSKAYSTLSNSFKYKNKKYLLSVDNNGEPCFLQNSHFINIDGDEIPNNFLPEGQTCKNAKIVIKKGQHLLKINSLNALNSLTKGKKFFLAGDGIKGIIKNCGNYWSDNCSNPKKAKVFLSLKGPTSFPLIVNKEALILTKENPGMSLLKASTVYKKNPSFFIWKKIDFNSKYSINSLINGSFANSAKDIYNKGIKTGIIDKYKQIFQREDMNGNICYFDSRGYPINEKGEEIKLKNLPYNQNCRTAIVKNGIYYTNLKNIVDFKNITDGDKVSFTFRNKIFVVEKCKQNYLSSNCKSPKKSNFFITNSDRNVFPRIANSKAIFVTKKVSHRTNTKRGIKTKEGLYIWKNKSIRNSINGLIDLPYCKTNCYDDNLQGALFALTSNDKIVKRKKINSKTFWVSYNERKVLSPRTKSFVNIRLNNLDGFTKNGLLFHNIKKKLSKNKAIKFCTKERMRLPFVKETAEENDNGLESDEWTWAQNNLDKKFGEVWTTNSLQKVKLNKKYKTICVY